MKFFRHTTCQVSVEGVVCLSVWRIDSEHLRPQSFQEKTEGSGIENIVESGVLWSAVWWPWPKYALRQISRGRERGRGGCLKPNVLLRQLVCGQMIKEAQRVWGRLSTHTGSRVKMCESKTKISLITFHTDEELGFYWRALLGINVTFTLAGRYWVETGQIMWGTLDGFKKYLGEKYLDTRGAERKQQLSHFQTFGCLPDRKKSAQLCWQNK